MIAIITYISVLERTKEIGILRAMGASKKDVRRIFTAETAIEGVISEGNFEIMAAVMAGGMVTTLAIALCTTFFENRFTESERKSGVVNYIMGLSFITEGAIPFAAGDPIHILPPCIVGSAVAGALSMAFKCGLPAPHGGIFVIGVITNPVQYLISVVVGAVIGMVVMSFTKKPLNNHLQ